MRHLRIHVVLIGLVPLSLAACNGQRVKKEEPTQLAPIIERLVSYGLEPHPHTGTAATSGAVYVPEDLREPYPASEVFAKPVGVTGKENPVMTSAGYVWLRKGDASISSPMLTWLGITAAAEAHAASQLVVSIDKLYYAKVRQNEFIQAPLSETFVADRLGSDDLHSIVAVDGVGYANLLTLQFLNATGASIEISSETVELLKARVSGGAGSASSEQFPNLVLGSRPIFRAGGPGSAMTPELALALQARFLEAGIQAELIGENMLVAPLKWEQVKPAYQLARALRDTEKTLARLDQAEQRIATVQRNYALMATQFQDQRTEIQAYQASLQSLLDEQSADERALNEMRAAVQASAGSLRTSANELQQHLMEVNAQRLDARTLAIIRQLNEQLEALGRLVEDE